MNYFKIVLIVGVVIFSVHSSFGHEEQYTGCEIVGEMQIKDGLCVAKVRDCRLNGRLLPPPPPGYHRAAKCDAVPQRLRDLPMRAGCPTDPNQCANDNEGDGLNNYSSNIIWRVLFSYGGYEAGDVYWIERRGRGRTGPRGARGEPGTTGLPE